MPRNGSGGYVPPVNTWNPATNGVSATAADYQALINDIAAAVQQSISADGQTPIVGNFNFNGNKIAGLAAGTGNGDALRFEQLYSSAGEIAGITSINGGQLAGLRNILINGNLAINQRGYVSGTATSGANQYTLDRWRVVTSGQALTFTASGNGNTMTAPAGGVEQVIEGLNIGGGTYVLGWTGTATATVNGTARAKGESFTLTANSNATVRLIGGTASLVQIEPGGTVTPFEHRPIGMELALCQRYYETGALSLQSYQTTSNNFYQTYGFKVSKRTFATIAPVSPAYFNASAVFLTGMGTEAFQFGALATALGTCQVTSSFTASAEL